MECRWRIVNLSSTRIHCRVKRCPLCVSANPTEGSAGEIFRCASNGMGTIHHYCGDCIMKTLGIEENPPVWNPFCNAVKLVAGWCGAQISQSVKIRIKEFQWGHFWPASVLSVQRTTFCTCWTTPDRVWRYPKNCQVLLSVIFLAPILFQYYPNKLAKLRRNASRVHFA